ncbi:hypothetical protein EDD11_006565 [Mortierella claussenii]|nr:hypothetical protein EDD11_006565 [Mortierella claussenii]
MAYQETYKPHVMIIGAGIAGLALAAALERANIPYEVFERESSVKPLGSALAFGPGVMPFFDQLGILDRIRARARIVGKNQIYRDQHGLQGVINYEIAEENGVRQSMYEHLEKEGKLPLSDKAPLGFSSACLVGQTKPLDPSTFDAFEDRFCRFDCILGNNSPYFPKVWPEDVRDFPVYCGDYTAMGDLIDLTPTDLMSKVMLEEKFFETWYDGRTVLVGDACHKMTPNAGLGATNGIFDAIVLSNYLSTLTTNNADDIARAFQQYQNERGPVARKAVSTSSAFSHIVGRAWYHGIIRKAVMSMPKWLWDKTSSERNRYRPQVSFLPPAHDPGSVRPLYQRSLEKTRSKQPSL